MEQLIVQLLLDRVLVKQFDSHTLCLIVLKMGSSSPILLDETNFKLVSAH